MIETLKSELADLEARHFELRAAHDARAAATATARDAFIDGNDEALQTVTETHSAVAALQSAVNELDERIKHKRGSLAAAELEAARIEAFEHRLAIMQRGEELLASYLILRTEANDTLKLLAEKLVAAFEALQSTRTEWLSSIDVNDANFSFDDFIAAGASDTAVRTQWDGTNRAASDKPYEMSHVLPFEDVLRIIFHITYESKKEAVNQAA
jgi:predicted  nucleic acid-binding Zn-ribbon protein